MRTTASKQIREERDLLERELGEARKGVEHIESSIRSLQSACDHLCWHRCIYCGYVPVNRNVVI